MTSHDPRLGENKALGFFDSIREQLARIPPMAAIDAPGAFGQGDLSYFSAARIYVTFKVKFAEHFPEDIPSETFDFLVDLVIHEWLSRSVGSDPSGEFGLPCSATLSPRIQHAQTLGFITIAADPDSDALCIVMLTPSGRARLTIFFDYMASYISVV